MYFMIFNVTHILREMMDVPFDDMVQVRSVMLLKEKATLG